MAKQTVNIGTVANDGTGDNLRVGADKLNDNFNELYTELGDGSALSSIQKEPLEGAFVDGDKTKLDGIETGADVTDTANVTAAGALMDSEVTNLAQVKAFSAADYATSAQGALADSATQPGDLATVATTGAYSDLSGPPSIPAELSDLSDIDATVSTPSDGDILVYRNAGTDWVLESKPAAGSNPAAADITDATADGIALITSADANPFTDADEAKLDGIEALADVTDAANVETAIEAITFTSVAGATGDEVMVVDATDGGLKAVLWENLPGASGGLDNIVEDTTPQLGGTLEMNGNVINNPVFTGSIGEERYAWTSTSGTVTDELDPANGTIQTLTLTGNITSLTDNVADGESITLLVADGASTYTLDTAGATVVDGGTISIPATGFKVLVFFKIGSTLYLKDVGDVA